MGEEGGWRGGGVGEEGARPKCEIILMGSSGYRNTDNGNGRTFLSTSFCYIVS